MPGRRMRGLTGVLAGLCLLTPPLAAGEVNQAIRVFSDGGGREVRIEVVSTGDRMMATPVAIIPEHSIRDAACAASAPGEILRPPVGEGKDGAGKPTAADDLLERAVDAVDPRGREDLSLGTLFRMVGDIRHDMKRGKGKSGRETFDALLGALQRAAGEDPPGAGEAGTAEIIPPPEPGKPALFSSGCTGSCIGFR